MSKVFFSVAMSLDGFIAPDGMDMEQILPTRIGCISGWR
jgi:hypothetical protein